jgi:hypothetical protein
MSSTKEEMTVQTSTSEVSDEGPQPLDMEKSPFWVRTRHRYREYFAEFMGTFTLLLFGCGVVAQVVLSKGQNGNFLNITFGLNCQIFMLSLDGVVELCLESMSLESAARISIPQLLLPIASFEDFPGESSQAICLHRL